MITWNLVDWENLKGEDRDFPKKVDLIEQNPKYPGNDPASLPIQVGWTRSKNY